MFTQPQMYAKISKHPSPLKVYREQLVSEGSFTDAELDSIETMVKGTFDKAWDISDEIEIPPDTWKGNQSSTSPWKNMKNPRELVEHLEPTGLDFEVSREIYCTSPFYSHPHIHPYCVPFTYMPLFTLFIFYSSSFHLCSLFVHSFFFLYVFS